MQKYILENMRGYMWLTAKVSPRLTATVKVHPDGYTWVALHRPSTKGQPCDCVTGGKCKVYTHYKLDELAQRALGTGFNYQALAQFLRDESPLWK